MRMLYYLPHLLIVSILLADILIYAGLIKIFFNVDETIIAGVIAFIGAIIGGFITYLGVNKTLKHRDRELFMNSAAEKLMNAELFRDKYSKYMNSSFCVEMFLEETDIKPYPQASSYAKSIVEDLKKDKEKIYKTMEYEAVSILSIHQKSLESLIRKKEFSDDDVRKYIEKTRDIFQVFQSSKERLEMEYRLLKSKR